MRICPNAYYNYRKHRKSDYHAQKENVKAQIREIYHAHNGVDGYRSMTVYLSRKGYAYSTGRPADWKVKIRTMITNKADKTEIIRLSLAKDAERSRQLVELPTR